MKFESLVMYNFMRYEGENRIDFSCDPEKNVTVVLGENTVGKTTIAQALRWGLYGHILRDKDKNEADYFLLNNDVAARLTSDMRAKVSVAISIVTSENRYKMCRTLTYRRRQNDYGFEQLPGQVSLTMGNLNSDVPYAEVEQNKIDDVINELLPMHLSNYFLFDGENWNDIRISGVRSDIKESVHILTGLSSMKNAMFHLKDMGSQSVISRFKPNIKGSGKMYDDLSNEADKARHEIDDWEKSISNLDIEITNAQTKIDEIDDWLAANKNTEELQKELISCRRMADVRREQVKSSHNKLVCDFSEKAYTLLAEPLIRKSVVLFRSANVERRDIPYMHQSTIDYLVERGRCVCGTCIKKDSKEYQELMEQRRYLPPADIGSELGTFERTANRWMNRNEEALSDIKEDIRLADMADRNERNDVAALDEIESRLDQHIDFSEKRAVLRSYQNELNTASIKKGELKGKIISRKSAISKIESEMQAFEAKDQETQKWKKRMKIANELYDELAKNYENRENKTFIDLNERIQYNFERMFHEKDKKIELDKDYNIKMFYKADGAYHEERNLSEGEKVARNFAFIVTMMEGSKKTDDDTGKSDNDALPIVLDGPFSKLGDANIGLIARVLPEAAEQVIIFMLDKDWKYTGLDYFVGKRYQIDKKPDENFATIRNIEG